MVQAAIPSAILAAVAAAVSVGELLEVLALAVGTGAGVGLGVRLALLQRLRRVAATEATQETSPSPDGEQAPIWREAEPPEWQPQVPAAASLGTTTSLALLFATAVGFALIGFFCGSISGFVALVVLQGVRFLATGLAFGIANLITGLVAGVIAGYLVEAFGRRWQVVDDELQGIPALQRRTVVIALAAGVVMGLLLGLLDTFGLGGTLLSVIGVGVVSVAMSLAVLQVRDGPSIQALFAKR